MTAAYGSDKTLVSSDLVRSLITFGPLALREHGQSLC